MTADNPLDGAGDPLDKARDALANGEPVDWAALAARLSSETDRELLENLRVVAAIGSVHGCVDEHSVEPSVPKVMAGPPVSKAQVGDSSGEVWGRYQLIEVVGEGNFGTVHRAWDPHLERELAIKILHRGTADARIKERLLREGKQLARVRDANVVSIHDVEEHDDRCGLCMEFVDGQTLEDVLRSRGTLNPREAVLVGQDVCRGLASAHGAGLVHRDVKARNIMRDRTGRIVLMDFGAGREVEELERANSEWNLAGTPLYMAPEVLAGHRATYASDLYSVGVLLYYLVTGKYPVTARTLKEIRTAHMFGSRVPISHRRTDLPPSFVKVVERALTANPGQRYQSAAEMLDDLGAANLSTLPQSSPVRPVIVAVEAVVAATAAITLLGAVITRYFNATMGRSEMANDGLRDWFTWGVRSLVAPAVYLGLTLAALAVAVVTYRLVRNALPAVRSRIEQPCVNWTRKFGLDTVDHLSSCVLIASVIFLAVACWRFSDLLEALFIFPDVSRASAAQLQRLSPAFHADHETYRQSFMWIVILCGLMWYVPMRLAAKRREPINRVILTGGVAVTGLALLLFAFPYRMLSGNDHLEVARWKQARCYILGERQNDVLLFCPELDPRDRIARAATSQVERMGTQESPFTSFSPHTQ